MEDGLRKGSLFQIDMGVKKLRDMDEFLQRARKYMDYEEEGAWRGQHEARPRKFSEHTLRNESQANILAECINTEYGNIKRPEPMVLKGRPESLQEMVSLSQEWQTWHQQLPCFEGRYRGVDTSMETFAVC